MTQNAEKRQASTTYAGLPSDAELLANPCTSFWLKDAIRESLNRDVCDAATDAEVLLAILTRRVDTALSNLGCARKTGRE